MEYNQLDPLLRSTINPEGDVNDATGAVGGWTSTALLPSRLCLFWTLLHTPVAMLLPLPPTTASQNPNTPRA